jgi:4,5-DOPA dioxygenase extradiol
MPALFLGHGNPMNAIWDNAFTRSLAALGRDLPRPDAIAVVSAHWLTGGIGVYCVEFPRTIHDFEGFPRELYEIRYPAPGAVAYAQAAAEVLGDAVCDTRWGLDHASWAVLRHMYPAADVPVFEISLDVGRSPAEHWRLARRLAPLRDHGVLVVGSGNVVHSFAGMRSDPDAEPHDWAVEFDAWAADALVRGDRDALVGYESLGRIADLAVPTNDHYLPMLYAAALRRDDEGLEFTYEGIAHASMSMRCARIG